MPLARSVLVPRRVSARVAPAYGWEGLAWGLVLFFAPGAVWSLCLARALSWPARVAIAVLLAFTLVPALMFVLDLAFGVPLRVGTFAAVSALVTAGGLLLLLRAR